MATIEDVRINGRMMGEYAGKTVRIVGKVNRVRSNVLDHDTRAS